MCVSYRHRDTHKERLRKKERIKLTKNENTKPKIKYEQNSAFCEVL